MKSGFLRIALAAAVSAAISFVATGPAFAQAKPVTLKLAHGASPDPSSGKAIQKCGGRREQKNGGAAKS